MSYKLWAFWRPRPEGTRACALRLARMFEGLAEIHHAFAHWNRQANTRAAANRPFCQMPPNVGELTQIFEKNLSRKDATGEPWPELGYSFGAWNGRDEACAVSFSLFAGSYSDHIPEPNTVSMHFRGVQAGNEHFITSKILKRALLAIAEAWDSDWGVVETRDYKGRLTDPAGQLRRPWGGWITYLAPHYAARIAAPPSVISERAPGGGLLMMATEESFSADNPQHVAAADAIQAALEPIQTSPRAPGS